MFCLVPCVLSSFSGNDPGIGCVPPCGYGIIIRSIGEYEPPHRGFRVFLILLWGVSDQSLYSVMDLIHWGVSAGGYYAEAPHFLYPKTHQSRSITAETSRIMPPRASSLKCSAVPVDTRNSSRYIRSWATQTLQYSTYSGAVNVL